MDYEYISDKILVQFTTNQFKCNKVAVWHVNYTNTNLMGILFLIHYNLKLFYIKEISHGG